MRRSAALAWPVAVLALAACGAAASVSSTAPVEIATPSTTQAAVTTLPATTTIATTIETTTTEIDAVKDVVIAEIHYDAEGNDNENQNDEWVRLENHGEQAVDMSGWILSDEGPNHTYVFADGFGIDPGGSVVVYTGCGQDTAAVVYWCSPGTAVWNNDGDTATLTDASGAVVDSSSY